MDMRIASLVAFGVVLLVSAAPSATNAQQKKDSASVWGEAVDLKPLVIPPIQPFLPPNSVLVPGSASSSQVQTPLYDPTRDQATPGLRLTIPTR
jgi:hypothetical protein